MPQDAARPVRDAASAAKVWALSAGVDEATLERLGDARQVADLLGTAVGALVSGGERSLLLQLFSRGADRVDHLPPLGIQSLVATTAAALDHCGARLILAPGDCYGREWAAQLAVRLRCKLVTPALMVRVIGQDLEVTALDRDGRRARKVRGAPDECLVVTLKPGVGEAMGADAERSGGIGDVPVVEQPERLRSVRIVRGDPATVDIRHAQRLVAGGRGVGGREGFDRLRRFAGKIGAGVAASRMAVDLGWAGHEKQVGQTGRTVAPDLYVACGISGASHHLDGMSNSRAIVAINTDPEAPIFKVAHLGLVSDLHAVLAEVEKRLEQS